MAKNPSWRGRGLSRSEGQSSRANSSSNKSGRKQTQPPLRETNQGRGRQQRAYEGRRAVDGKDQVEAHRGAKKSQVPELSKSRIIRGKKSWGALSRKGAIKAIDFREGGGGGEHGVRPRGAPSETFVPEVFVEVEKGPESPKPSSHRVRKERARVRTVDEVLEREVSRQLTPADKKKVERLLAAAIEAYEKDRYPEAKRLLEQVLAIIPDSLSALELYGLDLYRMGQWAAAIKVLEDFIKKSGSFDQHPVIADCYRAQRRYQDVDRIWVELSAASPSSDVIGEGRIVVAGAAADQGKLAKAIAILERSLSIRRKPTLVDLRQWYVLADLYERAGEIGHARSLFSRIIKHDANFFDAAERLSDLG